MKKEEFKKGRAYRQAMPIGRQAGEIIIYKISRGPEIQKLGENLTCSILEHIVMNMCKNCTGWH